MMDVGWGELLVLGVIALFIFGPDKLPKAAADAGRMVRKLRELAQSAQTELKSSGVDVTGIANDLKSVADLHPKRIISATVADARNAGSAPAMPADGSTKAEPAAQTQAATRPHIDPDAT